MTVACQLYLAVFYVYRPGTGFNLNPGVAKQNEQLLQLRQNAALKWKVNKFNVNSLALAVQIRSFKSISSQRSFNFVKSQQQEAVVSHSDLSISKLKHSNSFLCLLSDSYLPVLMQIFRWEFISTVFFALSPMKSEFAGKDGCQCSVQKSE